MGRRNRECYLCGTDYLYCPTCSQDKMKPSWMSEFHSESCKNIFDTCTRFNMGMMSKAEAKEALKSCDLSNKANFKSYVIRDIDTIFYEEPHKNEEANVIDVAPVRNKIKNKSHEVVIKKENE